MSFIKPASFFLFIGCIFISVYLFGGWDEQKRQIKQNTLVQIELEKLKPLVDAVETLLIAQNQLLLTHGGKDESQQISGLIYQINEAIFHIEGIIE